MNLVSWKGNWTETKFALVITPLIYLMKGQTRQLREKNVDAISLFVENSIRLFRKLEDKNYRFISVQLNQFYVFTEISSCSKDFKKGCAALLLTRLTAL